MSNVTVASWTDPTTNTDGTPIAAGEVSGFELGARDTSAAGSVAGTYPFTANVAAGATSALLSALTPTLPQGKPLAIAVRTLSTTNPDSAWSAEVDFTLVPPAPLPPSGLSVA